MIAKWLNNISGRYSKRNRRLFAKMIATRPNSKILDIGCGDGKLMRMLKAGHITGVEKSWLAASRAREYGFEVIECDVDKGLPLPNNYYDIVISNQVIEHVNNTDNFMRECHRILKSGGKCFISTPNLSAVHNIVALLCGYQPFSCAVSDEYVCGNPLDPTSGQILEMPENRHRRLFTARALKEIMEYHGFKVTKITGTGVIRYPKYAQYLIAEATKI